VLIAAAVCPHPPLLVPGVASGATGETDDLRAAAAAAVQALVDAEPDLLVVVGGGRQVGPCDPQARGSLAPYGVDLLVGTGTGEATLPLSLTIGLWLVEQHAPDVPRLLFGIHPETDRARCANLGATLAERATQVAMLVMGDGSARHSVKGPGYLDARAQAFDKRVAAALAAVEPQALLDLDPVLAEDLLVAGRAPWQVLAGAAAARDADARDADARDAEARDAEARDAEARDAGARHAAAPALIGDLRYAAAPYGVCYFVATWLPAAT
jgi:hypothetical protein